MNDYDFSTLNDKEFENLTIDLISRDRGKRFERFKAGCDGGIDGRYYREDEKEEIIQCKHYLKTGFKGLISSLKYKYKNSGKNEADKVKILNPDKYIFVTSLPLSASNKQKIKEIFEPYIKLDNDIYGQEDLNDLLKAYPDIEENHSQLWISSTNVLKRVITDAIKDKNDVEELKNKLIQKYQTNFKTITLLLNDEKTNEIFIKPAIIKEQTEKDKKEEAYKREAILNSYEEIHKPKEPIKIEELLNISNKSLIYGKAGVGKTTFCKYIAYKWVNNELYEAFDYVVYIALREWKRDGLKGAILDNYYSSDIKELYFDIEENNSKTLFLFDGYDELDADKKATLQKEINTYNLQNYIITTRPYGYQKSDFNVDESFETIGFTDKNIEQYIEAFFKENSEKSKGLKEFLQRNISIKHIAYIPLMLEMICSLWKEGKLENITTMSELYTECIENFFLEYTEKKETDYIQDKEEEIFKYLGKIAFEGLKQQKIVLDKNITKTIDKSFFVDYILKTGFLISEDLNKANPFLNTYQFLHLTFQEYFSALYVSKLSKKKQKKIIKKWKFYPHMQVFFAFLGGLIEDKEFLLSEIESDETVQLELYKFMLIVICLQNIKKEELKDERKNNILDPIYRIMKNQDFYKYPYIYENITSIHHLIEIDENKFSNQKEFSKKHHLENILFLFSIGKYDDDKIEEFKEIINSLDTENISDWLLKRRSFEKLITNGKYDKKVIDIFFDMKRYRQPIFGDKTRELFFKKYIGDYKEIIFKKIKKESYYYFINDNMIFNLFKYADYIHLLDEKEIDLEFKLRLSDKLQGMSDDKFKEPIINFLSENIEDIDKYQLLNFIEYDEIVMIILELSMDNFKHISDFTSFVRQLLFKISSLKENQKEKILEFIFDRFINNKKIERKEKQNVISVYRSRFLKKGKLTKKKEQIKNYINDKIKKEENINEEEKFSVEEFYLLLKKREDTLPHQLKDYLGKYHYKLESLPNDTLLNMVDMIKEKEDISNLYIQEAILFLLTPISQTDKYSILLKFLSKELENYYYGLFPKIMKILKKSISLEEFMNKNNILDNNKIMFLNEFSVKELFENYKTEYDYYYFEIIYYKIIENRLPLYLKDKKWHTVVDGEEIETQEELNEEDIKEYGREPSNKKKKLKQIKANTNDEELNKLIEEAKDRFISNDKQVAIEKLWDAFERLKTYFDKNKKESGNRVIEIISQNADKDSFEDEFKKLTKIGNNYRIRHHEIDKKELTDENREYFFKRMVALIDLCLRHLNEEENIVK